MQTNDAEVDAKLLAELVALRLLPDNEAKTLLAYLEVSEVPRGEPLWMEGDESAFAAFILSGRFEEKKATEFADKQIVVGVYGKGSMIGESSLLDNLPRPLTAVCLDNARLLSLTQARFEDLQEENPPIAMQVLKRANLTLAMRLRKSFERLAAIF